MTNALYIVWNDSNNTSIPIIDEQHRGIISNINSLHYLIQNGDSDIILEPILVTLKQYTIIHFKTEEMLMARAGYPGFEEHCSLHQGLAEKTDVVYQKAIANNEPELVLSFLRNWWLNHIIKLDSQYVPIMKKMLMK
ncbi:MAG: bacteriohemerythrin [Desulforhopalus sp.]